MMNIETANRLLSFRKKSGFSQEELAEKIGVSRQAVSKWERAEASPDTDNLIALAAVYGVTLDELITGGSTDGKPERDEPPGQDADSPPEKDHVSFVNGIHVHAKNGDKVDISWRDGVHVVSAESGDKVDVSWKDGVHVVSPVSGEEFHGHGHMFTHSPGNTANLPHAEVLRKRWHAVPYALFTVLLYLLFGIFDICGGWAVGWIIFLTIPLYYTLIDAICRKNPEAFAYPVLVAAIYLYFGMVHNLWHPLWVLFFTIPLYYCITSIFKK